MLCESYRFVAMELTVLSIVLYGDYTYGYLNSKGENNILEKYERNYKIDFVC